MFSRFPTFRTFWALFHCNSHCSWAGKHAQQSATQPIFILESPKISVRLVSPSFTIVHHHHITLQLSTQPFFIMESPKSSVP